MLGNGAQMNGKRIAVKSLKMDKQTKEMKDFALFVAGLGLAMLTSAPSRIASGATPIAGATILGFVCPGTKITL